MSFLLGLATGYMLSGGGSPPQPATQDPISIVQIAESNCGGDIFDQVNNSFSNMNISYYNYKITGKRSFVCLYNIFDSKRYLSIETPLTISGDLITEGPMKVLEKGPITEVKNKQWYKNFTFNKWFFNMLLGAGCLAGAFFIFMLFFSIF